MAVRFQGGKAFVASTSKINLRSVQSALANASIALKQQIDIARSEGDAKYAAGLQAGWDLLQKARERVTATLMQG